VIYVYGRADPAVLIICIRLIFGSTVWPNTNSAFCPLFGAEYHTNRIFGIGLTGGNHSEYSEVHVLQ